MYRHRHGGARESRRQPFAHIGNELADPFIDYASLAKAYGVHGQGPIDESERSGPRDQARDRGREARRAGARRRAHAAAMSMRRDDHLVRSVAFAAVLFASSIAARPPRRPRAAGAAGNAATGKTPLHEATCFFCHGTAGQGGIAGAPPGGRRAQHAELHQYVRRPSGQMPAYHGNDPVRSGARRHPGLRQGSCRPRRRPPRFRCSTSCCRSRRFRPRHRLKLRCPIIA